MSCGGAHLATREVGTQNASPSAFGWQFQFNAAIMLFINRLPDAEEMVVEGATDDVEVYLADGSSILCQAKANFSNEPGKGATTRLADAMKTLVMDCKDTKCIECLYVTNDKLPFGRRVSHDTFGEETLLAYKELSPKAQAIIQNKCEAAGGDADLLANKFHVYVFKFYGDDERTKTEVVRRRIRDWMQELDIIRINETALQRTYSAMMQENSSTDNPEVKLSKSDFLWPIIVQACQVSQDDSLLQELDDDLRQDVLEGYSGLIDDYSQRFELVTKVISDFESFRRERGTSSALKDMRAFIDLHASDYAKEMGADALNEDIVEVFCKLVLQKVLARRGIVEKVREGTGLAY